jgi:hypothetical protein
MLPNAGMHICASSRRVVQFEFKRKVLYATEVDIPAASVARFFGREEPAPDAVVGRESAPFMADGKTCHDGWEVKKVGHDVEG